MKFNFWQIIGGVLLALGLLGVIYKEYLAPAPATPPSPATRPNATTLPLAALPTGDGLSF